MLRGRFGNTTGRPYLEGRLILPRVSKNADISFLVDTGADSTMLMPADGGRMGLDYTQLQNPVQVNGANGAGGAFRENGLLITLDRDQAKLIVFSIDVLIGPPSPDMMATPTLLGRDVIDRCLMTYRPMAAELLLEVLSNDGEVPINLPLGGPAVFNAPLND